VGGRGGARVCARRGGRGAKGTRVGPFPTEMVWTTLPVAGSIRVTRPVVLSLAHKVPPPNVSSVAAIGSVAVTAPLSASILVTVSSPVLATHTEPPAQATPTGPFPTLIRWTAVFGAGSMPDTVPSRLFATHTLPFPTAIPLGSLPTVMVCTTRLSAASIRETLSPSALVTQTAPSPAATWLGVAPTGICAKILFVFGSITPTAFVETS